MVRIPDFLLVYLFDVSCNPQQYVCGTSPHIMELRTCSTLLLGLYYVLTNFVMTSIW